MKTQLKKTAPTIMLTALAGLTINPVFADFRMEEIVITAQKRDSSVSDTPIAITAISADQMRELGIASQQDVANFTPSMQYQEAAGGSEENRIYLRGIGRETNSLGTEPGVGVYVNGFYSNEAGALTGSSDRIDRVEILRGPQGTLFGRNTTGGAINVVSKKPGQEIENVARVNVGSYSHEKWELTSSGPITDNVGYLVHYTQNDRDSFFDNVSGPDQIGISSDYTEVMFDIDFSDRINWNIRYATSSFEDESLELGLLKGYDYHNGVDALSRYGPQVMNAEAFSPLAIQPAENDPFDISSEYRGKVAADDTTDIQSTLTIDLDAFSIRIMNSDYDLDWYGEKDFDGTAGPVTRFEKIGQTEQNNQHEIQFVSNGEGDLDWIVGLFYFSIENVQPYTLSESSNPYLINNVQGPIVGTPAPRFNPEGIFYFQQGELDATSQAIYTQFDWRATDRLTLSAGLRYSEDEKEAYEEQDILFDSVLDFCDESLFSGLVAGGDPYADIPGCLREGYFVSEGDDEFEETWYAFNWRLNATYDITDDSMVYATVSTGSKPGGFRLGGLQNDPSTPENEAVIDNEELTAYELGYKGFLGEDFSFSSAIYYYDYSDIQVELDIIDPVSGLSQLKLTNASETEVYGFEIESSWNLTDKLSLLGNYSYMKSEYKDDFFAFDLKTDTERNVKGNELNRTPNDKFSLSSYYVQPFDSGDIVFTLSYSYISDQYTSIYNDSIEQIDSYEVVNTRLSWQPASGGYEISIYGRNLTDELSYANRYSVSGQRDGVRASGRPIDPETYGMEVAVFF
ncbi:TonB-dependent receptor [Oceanicoccus sagamiensis]|nr:TonB-dependent receptor [Oceanicoccus sagamiensis]